MKRAMTLLAFVGAILLLVADDTLARGGGGGGGVTGSVIGGSVWAPNSWRMSSLTKSDASSPQLGQMNFTGCCNISGLASKAYFAPQEHCSFIVI